MMNDANLAVLHKMLDAAALRHRVVANMHPRAQPGAAGDGGRSDARPAEGWQGARGPARADGNNVSLERELADLMKNALLYRTCTQLLSARIAGYRAAITGRSGGL